MFDIGFAEIIVISAVTLVVIGPKEIPNVVRGVVQGARKLRGYVNEFQSGVTDFVDSAGVQEIKDEFLKEDNTWKEDFAVGGEEKDDPYAPTQLKESAPKKAKKKKAKAKKAKKASAKKAKKSVTKKKTNKGASS